jgi:pyruvate kinase
VSVSWIRIVATIGPATATVEGIEMLASAGMDVARLNGSHADLPWHADAIRLLRTTVPDVPILLDIPGRKIRTRQLVHPPSFASGDALVLTTAGGHDGRFKVPVSSDDLHERVGVGDRILADDGTLGFTVTALDGRDIVCRAENAGTLGSAKGINVPGLTASGKGLSERDIAMIEFTKTHGVDFVGISFVESSAHVEEVRTLTGAEGPRVLSKVENLGAMANLAEIIDASDAVMVDRGDLSVETNLESVALFQKRILRQARESAKPVIVATEMLHSMIQSPFPTKAEVSDITNAVLDGASALMLSGETAVGRFPREAVTTMRRIADTVAESEQVALDDTGGETVPQAMAAAISLMCRRLSITKIVAITGTGYAARMVAASRPRQKILAVTNSASRVRSLNLLYGTEAVHVPIAFSRTSTDHIAVCLKELWVRRKLVDDDLVLVTAVGYPKHGTRMNLIQTHAIADLKDSLNWSDRR